VLVGEERLHADKIFLNVGGRAFVPDVPGIREIDFLTNGSMMSVDPAEAKRLVATRLGDPLPERGASCGGSGCLRLSSPLGGRSGFSDGRAEGKRRTHSTRIVSTGSTATARRAGKYVAGTAAATSTTGMVAKVIGSSGLTPNSSDSITLVKPTAPARLLLRRWRPASGLAA
jgi:hypothetical protein